MVPLNPQLTIEPALAEVLVNTTSCEAPGVATLTMPKSKLEVCETVNGAPHPTLHGVEPVAASQAALTEGVSAFGHSREPPALSKLTGLGTAGAAPVSALSCTRKPRKALTPASDGIAPVSWFALTSNWRSAGTLTNAGIDPESWLP